MESNSADVNDDEPHLQILYASLVADDEVGRGAELFPNGSGVLRPGDRSPIDAGHDVAWTEVERRIGQISREQLDDSKADEATTLESRLGFDVL